jgi:hypothetical protein
LTENNKQQIVMKVFQRCRDRGIPIDDDPQFVAVVEDWAAGLFDMTESRRRFGEILERRRNARREAALATLDKLEEPFEWSQAQPVL